jgi:hypothetical protein
MQSGARTTEPSDELPRCLGSAPNVLERYRSGVTTADIAAVGVEAPPSLSTNRCCLLVDDAISSAKKSDFFGRQITFFRPREKYFYFFCGSGSSLFYIQNIFAKKK